MALGRPQGPFLTSGRNQVKDVPARILMPILMTCALQPPILKAQVSKNLVLKNSFAETSPAVQWLRLHAFHARDIGLIPGRGSKIPYPMRCGQSTSGFASRYFSPGSPGFAPVVRAFIHSGTSLTVTESGLTDSTQEKGKC